MSYKTVENRFNRYGKNLCLSCGQKGSRNPIYNKKSEISYKVRRSSIEVICDFCGKKYLMTYERASMRKAKYGKNLCLSCSKVGDLNPFFAKKFSEEQLKLLSTIRKKYYSDKNKGNERRKLQSDKFFGDKNPCYKKI